MAYKIRIKHDFEGKTLPIHLKYNDSNYNLPEIPVDLTDAYQVVPLYDWESIVGTLDGNKVIVKETQITQGNYIYQFNNVRISFEDEPSIEGREFVPVTLKVRFVQRVVEKQYEYQPAEEWRDIGTWEAHAWLDIEDDIVFPVTFTADDGTVTNGTVRGGGHGTVIPGLYTSQRMQARTFRIDCKSRQFSQDGTKYYEVQDIKTSYDTLPDGSKKYDADGFCIDVGKSCDLDGMFFMYGAGSDLANARINNIVHGTIRIPDDGFDLTDLLYDPANAQITTFPSDIDLEEREFGFKRKVSISGQRKAIICLSSKYGDPQTGKPEGKCITGSNTRGIAIFNAHDMTNVTDYFDGGNIEYYEYTYNEDGTVATQQFYGATVFLSKYNSPVSPDLYICKEGGIYDNNNEQNN